ncbi:MAG: lipoyl(octanoyl) transferase LipB [Verrucomicrobiota bacterium]
MDPMSTHAHTLAVEDWGRTRYTEALERQKALVDRRRKGEAGDTLVFTEHAPVYTTGLRKGAARHLVWDEAALHALGIEFVASNRGGDITYHGPGQIVAYPILSLQHSRDLHAYLRGLEEVVIRSLAHFGLQSDRREGKTGIWLESRKICAIGVAVRSWVTYHGFALNLAPDLSHFNGIVPCGITDGSVTSMQRELGRAVDPDAVKARLAVEFREVFREVLRRNGS